MWLQELRWLLTVVVVVVVVLVVIAGQSVQHLDVNADGSKRETRKNMHFERYSPVILGILMYGAVDKVQLGKTLFPNWRHILSQN